MSLVSRLQSKITNRKESRFWWSLGLLSGWLTWGGLCLEPVNYVPSAAAGFVVRVISGFCIGAGLAIFALSVLALTRGDAE